MNKAPMYEICFSIMRNVQYCKLTLMTMISLKKLHRSCTHYSIKNMEEHNLCKQGATMPGIRINISIVV